MRLIYPLDMLAKKTFDDFQIRQGYGKGGSVPLRCSPEIRTLASPERGGGSNAVSVRQKRGRVRLALRIEIEA